MRNPLTLGVQCRAPSSVLASLGTSLRQGRTEHLTRGVHPSTCTRVRGKDHWANHALGQRFPIPVGVVRHRHDFVSRRCLVLHERNALVRLRAKRCARQAHASACLTECGAHRFTPRKAVSRVVNLVENDQCAFGGGTRAMQHWVGCHLGIGGDVAVHICAHRSHTVGQLGIQKKSDRACSIGPLSTQVIGRHHHDHAINESRGLQTRGQGEGERGFAGAGGRGDEEILGRCRLVSGQGLALPLAQALFGTGGHRRASLLSTAK